MMQLFIVLICVFLMACSPVSSWQRGQLAQDNMALDTDPLEMGLRQHMQFSKEAASGGYGGAGGGCGCN
jgi:hypothetical protein